ncbi:MAG: hypothetical protein AAFR23_05325 [Pseudomonadota bacterium]
MMTGRRIGLVLIVALTIMLAGFPSRSGSPVDDRTTLRAASALTSGDGANAERVISRTRSATVTPRILASLNAVDGQVGAYLQCRADRGCSEADLPWALIAFWVALIVLQLALIALAGFALTGTINGTILATLIAIGAGRLFDYPWSVSDHSVLQTAGIAVLALGVAAVRWGSIVLAIGCGLAIGLCIVVHPLLLPLVIVVPTALLAAHRSSTRKRIAVMAAAFLSAVLMGHGGQVRTAPEQARSFAGFHMPEVVRRDLMQRTGYNSAPVGDHFAALISSLPLVGETITSMAFGRDAHSRINQASPGSIRTKSAQSWVSEFRRNTIGGHGNQVRYVISRTVDREPFGHVLTTLVFALKLMIGTAGLAGVVALACLPSLWRGSRGRANDAVVAAVLLWIGIAIAMAAVATPLAWANAALVLGPAILLARVFRSL